MAVMIPIRMFKTPSDTNVISQFLPDVTRNENSRSDTPSATYKAIR